MNSWRAGEGTPRWENQVTGTGIVIMRMTFCLSRRCVGSNDRGEEGKEGMNVNKGRMRAMIRVRGGKEVRE